MIDIGMRRTARQARIYVLATKVGAGEIVLRNFVAFESPVVYRGARLHFSQPRTEQPFSLAKPHLIKGSHFQTWSENVVEVD